MRETGNLDLATLGELEQFRSIQRLHNHWSRPISPQAYYWYLTFERSPQLHSLAAECQRDIAFPYYDLMPLRDLHLTLGRIASADDITPGQLDSIEAAAIKAGRKISPFNVTIGALGGTPGALGFTAFPVKPIRELRDTFRAAILISHPDAPAKDSAFHPHVTIAYANSDVLAAEARAAVGKLNSLCVDVTINEVALVMLKRHQRSYKWWAVSRIPLALP